VQTNLDGVFYCSKLGAEVLRDGGRIINVSSISAVTGFHGQANYAAAKAGVIALTTVMAKEVARRGITVNAVAPGTTMGHKIQTMATPDQIARMTADNPIPRPAEPIEQAHGFLYLASDEARYVTGHVLVIDGGTLLGKVAPLFE
jgi:3-oxoacyl-[acyl-carrier protein] reductase